MKLQIRSTHISKQTTESATVQLLISDNAEEDKVLESLQLCIHTDFENDAYLPKIQSLAMKRAKEILDQVLREIQNEWGSRQLPSSMKTK